MITLSFSKNHFGKTYIFRNSKGSWDRMEDMPTPRDEVMCGPVKAHTGGPVEEVVVAGGCTGDPTAVVEIFNLKFQSWRTGNIRIVNMAIANRTCDRLQCQFAYSDTFGKTTIIKVVTVSTFLLTVTLLGPWSRQCHCKQISQYHEKSLFH